MNLFCAILLTFALAPTSAFLPTTVKSRSSRTTTLRSLIDEVETVFKEDPPSNADFDKIIQDNFSGALTNVELATRVAKALDEKGYTASNTLVATSLCCDELARRLEKDLVKIFGKNFNLGGLSGFPFAGNTGFGAMSSHIPDDGYCFIVYGPHVGVAADGTVGKVERDGIELVDNCCGSAIAASNYLKDIAEGNAKVTMKIKMFTDFQQNAVQELILPHGQRLTEAKNRMVELPYALFDSQDLLMREIVKKGSLGDKRGLALLGGIQINTGPTTSDYFHPLRFDYMNNEGEIEEDMLPKIIES